MATKLTLSPQARKEVEDKLRKLITRDTTVLVIYRARSASGMTHRLSFYVMLDNVPHSLDAILSAIGGFKWSAKHEAIEVGGAGFSKSRHVLDCLHDWLGFVPSSTVL